MPFFPAEHDWTLTARPHRIPLDECFPGRYAVNSLPTLGVNRSIKDPRPPLRGPQHTDNHAKENPNFIPLNHVREEGELSGIDGLVEPEHVGPIHNWTKVNEDQHQLSNKEGW